MYNEVRTKSWRTFYRGQDYNREKPSCKIAQDNSHRILDRISSRLDQIPANETVNGLNSQYNPQTWLLHTVQPLNLIYGSPVPPLQPLNSRVTFMLGEMVALEKELRKKEWDTRVEAESK